MRDGPSPRSGRCIHPACAATRKAAARPGSWICAPHRRALPPDLAAAHARCAREVERISRWPRSSVNDMALSMASVREARCVEEALSHFSADDAPAQISDFMRTIGIG